MVDFSKHLNKKKENPMTNDLTVTNSGLPAIPEPAELKEIFDNNLDGVTFSFETVKVPSGGGIAFDVIDDNGAQDIAKEITGVVLDHYPTRAYWPERFGGGNQPPTCTSMDAKTGSLPRNANGEFGTCHDCKWSQFGSAEDGRQQACKFMHRVFILRAGSESIFPVMLSLPPSSTGKYDGSFSTYAIKLSGRMKKISDVISKVKLITDKSKDGITYSKVVFYYESDVPPEERAKIEFLRANLKSAMRQRPMDEEVAAEKPAAKSDGTDPWDAKPKVAGGAG
jgi:hypothetical protein